MGSSAQVRPLPHDWRDGVGALPIWGSRQRPRRQPAHARTPGTWSGSLPAAALHTSEPGSLPVECDVPASSTSLKLGVGPRSSGSGQFVARVAWVSPEIADPAGTLTASPELSLQSAVSRTIVGSVRGTGALHVFFYDAAGSRVMYVDRVTVGGSAGALPQVKARLLFRRCTSTTTVIASRSLALGRSVSSWCIAFASTVRIRSRVCGAAARRGPVLPGAGQALCAPSRGRTPLSKTSATTSTDPSARRPLLEYVRLVCDETSHGVRARAHACMAGIAPEIAPAIWNVG